MFRGEVAISKTVFRKEYPVLLAHLRSLRQQKGWSQEELAAHMGESQRFISRCESGERRLDYLELRDFCRATGVSFLDFVQQLEKALEHDDEAG